MTTELEDPVLVDHILRTAFDNYCMELGVDTQMVGLVDNMVVDMAVVADYDVVVAGRLVH